MRNGDTILLSAGIRQSNQLLPNDTLNRTADRTCTQKHNVPTPKKQDFVKYKKMTKEIDLSPMTNSKEKLPECRDQLETEIKDTFIWVIGQNAITEMTKTVSKGESSSLPLHKFTHSSDYILLRKGRYTIAVPITLT